MFAFLDGYKTYIAAVGAMASGVVMLTQALTADPFDPKMLWEAVLTIFAGFGMLGFRSALNKTGGSSTPTTPAP